MSEISDKEINELLKQEALQQRIDNSNEKKINWFKEDELYFSDCDKIKGYLCKMYHKSENKLFIWAHSRDKIIGKPQLLFPTKQRIKLVTKIENKDKQGNVTESYKFIDDLYDKRHDGYPVKTYDLAFYVYKVVYDDMEYNVLSPDKLDPEVYSFSGMILNMSSGAEITKNLKISSLSNIFLSKEAKPSVNILPKKDLIRLMKYLRKNIKLNKKAFIELMFVRDNGKVYLHSDKYNLIRMAQLLSGKYDGYPLHMGNMGIRARGKTFELEALDYKFQEKEGVSEAGSGTPKGLVPSFKESTPKLGAILGCHRIALIDELMKMVANAGYGTRSADIVRGALGHLNMLLEHKKRNISSGNSSLIAKATAKCIFSMNPFEGKHYLADHLFILDQTTMSRILWLVIDEEEKAFLDDNRPYKWVHKAKTILTCKDRLYDWKGVPTNVILTIYDSCQAFLSKIDIEKVRAIFNTSLTMAQKEMYDVWKARGLHHSILLLDGIVKMRCLFSSSDNSFEARKQDYDMLQVLLTKIVLSWNTEMKLEGNQ